MIRISADFNHGDEAGRFCLDMVGSLIRSGLAVTGVVGVAGEAVRAVKRAMSRAARSWAACLGRIFAVDVSKCAKCGGEMKAVAVITEDGELDRILAHLDLEADFPKAKPARSPPRMGGEDTQVDPAVEAWEATFPPSLGRC